VQLTKSFLAIAGRYKAIGGERGEGRPMRTMAQRTSPAAEPSAGIREYLDIVGV